MSPDLAFTIANTAVIPAWLLLALAPNRAITHTLVHALWIPVLLAVAYLAAFATNPASPEDGGFGSLAGVMALFTSPHAVLAGWIHYLAFDLFVGAWEVRDAARRDVPHLLVVPCLALTLMLGPAGLMTYLIVRYARTRVWRLDEAAWGARLDEAA